MDAVHGCGCILGRLRVAEGLLAAVVKAGAARHVVASVAVGLFRTVIEEENQLDKYEDPEVHHEVDIRVRALREDLVHKGSAWHGSLVTTVPRAM